MRTDGDSGGWEGDVRFSLAANCRFMQIRYKFVDDETSKHADVHLFFFLSALPLRPFFTPPPSKEAVDAVKPAALQLGRCLH